MRKLLTARIALVLISMGMIACGDNGEDNPIGPAGPEAELVAVNSSRGSSSAFSKTAV